MLLVFGLVGIAYAELMVVGYGTIVNGGSGDYQLIYDTDIDITWLDFTKSNDFWLEQMSWADGLEVEFGGIVFDDWQLPRTLPVNGSEYMYYIADDGSTDSGYNISAPDSAYPGSKGSEMAHLYYTTLGNLGFYDVNGNEGQPGYGLKNTGPFVNLLAEDYWSSTQYAPVSTSVWDFDFDYGRQSDVGKTGDPNVYALAVRDGNIASVPDASIILLLGSSLFGLGVFSRKPCQSKCITCDRTELS